jgi:uncharacterized membrane protein YeaQ/YmgE (transglycosylase-associated protein family)
VQGSRRVLRNSIAALVAGNRNLPQKEISVGLIVTLIVGLIVGAIAKLLMPGSDPGGWIMTIVLGIAGSFVGNLIAGALGMAGPVGWIGSVLGAMLLLFIYRLIKKA